MKYDFCIDLDGTLKTESDFDCTGFDNTIIVNTSKDYEMIARNGIKEFLEAAKRKGKVYLTTAAGTGYGIKVTKALGVHGYFSDIIGSDKMVMGNWPQFAGKIIWIDNDSHGVDLKMNRLPYTVKNKKMETWIIPTFVGVPDDTMAELVAEIERL